MGESIQTDKALTWVLAACAVTLTLLAVRREFFPGPKTERPIRVDDWDKLIAVGTPLTESGGPITILEFSDFQCPFCRRFAYVLDTLEALYPGQVQVVFRHFPIAQRHVAAREAALASECAAAQGRFNEYHDALFAAQDSLGVVPWLEVAARATVPDMPAFERCLASESGERRLAADSSAAVEVQLRGTPTVVVNGWRMPGTPSVAEVVKVIEKHVKKARKYGKW